MLEILQQPFMVRALLAGLLAALTTGLIGNFVVAGRQSVMSDMLAHVALMGVGIGVILGQAPVVWAMVTCVFGALALWGLTRQHRFPPEALAVVLLTGGLAVALLLTHLAKHNPVSFDSYLFGSILTIRPAELVTYAWASLGIVAILGVFWNRLLAVVTDAAFARSRFAKALWYELLFLILVSLVVAISLRVIGGLLISAMLVIPVLSAQRWVRSFRASVVVSILINLLAVVIGVVSSYYLDVPTSSAIVLSLIGVFALSGLAGRTA